MHIINVFYISAVLIFIIYINKPKDNNRRINGSLATKHIAHSVMLKIYTECITFLS